MKSLQWFRKKERGTNFSLKLLSVLYRIAPRRILNVILYPVIGYFYLTDQTARSGSIKFLKKLSPQLHAFKLYLMSYKHFYAFGSMFLDTMDTWLYKFSPDDIDWHNKEIILERLGSRKGGIVLSAHFGCLEVCKSLQARRENLRIIPLMYLKNSVRYRNFLRSINPEYDFEYIPIETINAGIAVSIKTRIDEGQYIALLADRLAPSTPERTIRVQFLGDEVELPEGPFAIAWALKVDIFTVFSSFDRQVGRYQVRWDKIETSPSYRRESKFLEIKQIAQAYADNLEQEVRKNPLQWFNFYDFWEKSSAEKN